MGENEKNNNKMLKLDETIRLEAKPVPGLFVIIL